MELSWTTFAGIALGIGLAAATGFRVFLPLLIAGLAAHFGFIPLSENFQWLASTPALMMLGTAAAAEVLAYYIPGVDHALDVMASPATLVAGAVASAAVVGGKWPTAAFQGAVNTARHIQIRVLEIDARIQNGHIYIYPLINAVELEVCVAGGKHALNPSGCLLGSDLHGQVRFHKGDTGIVAQPCRGRSRKFNRESLQRVLVDKTNLPPCALGQFVRHGSGVSHIPMENNNPTSPIRRRCCDG